MLTFRRSCAAHLALCEALRDTGPQDIERRAFALYDLRGEIRDLLVDAQRYRAWRRIWVADDDEAIARIMGALSTAYTEAEVDRAFDAQFFASDGPTDTDQAELW
jgi:hypothetical protein